MPEDEALAHAVQAGAEDAAKRRKTLLQVPSWKPAKTRCQALEGATAQQLSSRWGRISGWALEGSDTWREHNPGSSEATRLAVATAALSLAAVMGQQERAPVMP